MTITITVALVAVTFTLLSALIALTWRSATLATQLLAAIGQLRTETDELKRRTGGLDSLPQIEQRLHFVERHMSEMPRALSRITVLEEAAKFSKEMRQVLMRQSRPDNDDR